MPIGSGVLLEFLQAWGVFSHWQHPLGGKGGSNREGGEEDEKEKVAHQIHPRLSPAKS